MQRSLVAGLVCATLALAALPLAGQDATPPAAGTTAAGQARQRRPMPKPTNLQVLPKDISSPDLMALMRGYAKALGVECEFCHAEDPKTHRLNFALDTKPDKAIARTMIRMTQEINQKYMSTIDDPDATPADKTVTCGTCHRGNEMPAPFAAPAGSGMHHEPESAPPPKPQ
jgi:thioredoxin reductase